MSPRAAIFNGYDFSTPVLIPNCFETEYNGLNQVRSLGRLGVPVYGVFCSRDSPTRFSRYIKNCFFVEPTLFSTDEKILDSLTKIAKKIGRPSVLPISIDSFAKFAARNYDELKDFFYLPRQDSSLLEGLCDKWRMYLIADENKIPTARTAFPKCINDVLQFSSNAVFPVILKAKDWTVPDRRPPVIITFSRSAKELVLQYETITQHGEFQNVILQEYIHGGRSQEWIFTGYFNDQSKCLAAFTGKKLRQVPIHGGTTTLGECSRNEVLESMSISFLQAIGCSGVVDLDYKYDDKEGLYKLLDVNPRIAMNFRVFVGKNGMDIVRALYLDRTGQGVPQDTQIEGRKWIVEDRDLFSAFTNYREGILTPSKWIKSLGGVKEGAWFALDDPFPFFCRIQHHLIKKIPGFVEH